MGGMSRVGLGGAGWWGCGVACCVGSRDVGVVGWRGGRDVDDVEYWALGRRLCAEGVEHRWVREVLILLRLIYAATDHHLLSEPGCIA